MTSALREAAAFIFMSFEEVEWVDAFRSEGTSPHFYQTANPHHIAHVLKLFKASSLVSNWLIHANDEALPGRKYLYAKLVVDVASNETGKREFTAILAMTYRPKDTDVLVVYPDTLNLLLESEEKTNE